MGLQQGNDMTTVSKRLPSKKVLGTSTENSVRRMDVDSGKKDSG